MVTAWGRRRYRSGAAANIFVGFAANSFATGARIGAERVAGTCADGAGSGVDACERNLGRCQQRDASRDYRNDGSRIPAVFHRLISC